MTGPDMDDYRREDPAAAVVREWINDTFGPDHPIACQAVGGATGHLLTALMMATGLHPSTIDNRPELPPEVLTAWADLITAERRNLDHAERALHVELARRPGVLSESELTKHWRRRGGREL